MARRLRRHRHALFSLIAQRSGNVSAVLGAGKSIFNGSGKFLDWGSGNCGAKNGAKQPIEIAQIKSFLPSQVIDLAHLRGFFHIAFLIPVVGGPPPRSRSRRRATSMVMTPLVLVCSCALGAMCMGPKKGSS